MRPLYAPVSHVGHMVMARARHGSNGAQACRISCIETAWRALRRGALCVCWPQLSHCRPGSTRAYSTSIAGDTSCFDKEDAGSLGSAIGADDKLAHPVPAWLHYWLDVLGAVDRPSALGMISSLNYSDITGVDPSERGVSTAKDSVYNFISECKRKHPTKLVLARVGDFYETIGYDAVVLVQYTGLNPMGSKGAVPKAGFPVPNLRRTLQDLVDCGFSSLVCEEIDVPVKYGARPKRKKRYIAGIVTPASPTYVHRLVEEKGETSFVEAKPVLGLAASVQGYVATEVHLDLRRSIVHDSLTEEAVVAILTSGNFAPPVYLHNSMGSMAKDWQRLEPFLGSIHTEKYDSHSPYEGLLSLIRKDLALTPDACFEMTTSDRRHLYLSTARHLGLLPGSNSPNLLDYLLPPRSPSLCRRYLKKLLHDPPSKHVADAIGGARTELVRTPEALPSLECMSPAKIVRLLNAREANTAMFVQLDQMLEGTKTLLGQYGLKAAIEHLLVVAEAETGYSLSREGLMDECSIVLEEIRQIVVDGIEPQYSHVEHAPRSFIESNEEYLGRVREDASERIRTAYGRVSAAAADLDRALGEELVPFTCPLDGAKSGNGKTPHLVHDIFNNTVWLGAKRAPDGAQALVHPVDRRGIRVMDRLSTPRVEEALEEYRNATVEASWIVNAELKDLSERCNHHIQSIVTAATMSIVARTLILHCQEAVRRQWCVPSLVEFETSDVQAEVPGLTRLSLDGLFPFWMDLGDPDTQANDVRIDGFVLLTGPNMAGKSTISRSICAAALLAGCGLCVPAARAEIPRYDAFLVRGATGDSPTEKKSSFAVEMMDARTILRDATPCSLVLIDELGRGTEPDAGCALGASVLESLDEIGTHGIFSTHLHRMLDLPLKLERTQKMCMEIEQEPSIVAGEMKLKPTWRMIQGECRESLAFEVAQSEGVPLDVVERSKELLALLLKGGNDGTSVATLREIVDPLIHAIEAAADRDDSIRQAVLSMQGRVLSKDSRMDMSRDSQTKAMRPSLPTLESAADIMQDVAKGYSTEFRGIFIRSHQVPPPDLGNRSCVYIMRTPDGWFYCGESDDVQARITSHRSRRSHATKSLNQDVMNSEFAVLILPKSQGKSNARAIETCVVRSLVSRQFPMLGTGDAAHKVFGGVSARSGESTPSARHGSPHGSALKNLRTTSEEKLGESTST